MRNSSGSLAMFAAILRASLLSNLAADRRWVSKAGSGDGGKGLLTRVL